MDELSKRYFGLIMDKVKKENEFTQYLRELQEREERKKLQEEMFDNLIEQNQRETLLHSKMHQIRELQKEVELLKLKTK